jgi:hypothetical protein
MGNHFRFKLSLKGRETEYTGEVWEEPDHLANDGRGITVKIRENDGSDMANGTTLFMFVYPHTGRGSACRNNSCQAMYNHAQQIGASASADIPAD